MKRIKVLVAYLLLGMGRLGSLVFKSAKYILGGIAIVSLITSYYSDDGTFIPLALLVFTVSLLMFALYALEHLEEIEAFVAKYTQQDDE